jgi:ADP-ribosylglycohydrolase
VLDTLRASLFCFSTTKTYKDAVLKAVNLGDDTDTTAAVTGALAGLYYGLEAIPAEWLKVLANSGMINDIAEGMAERLKVNGY